MTLSFAFLFLIYDTINQEELWNAFFSNVDPSKYTIYIHYKDNKPLKFFEKYKLSSCIETKYAHVSLIHAQNLLLYTALQNPNNYKFIFISQACIPLKSFDYIYNFLSSDNNSHFSKMGGTVFSHSDMILNYYPKYKASQWCILNRNLASIFSNADKDSIDTLYSTIYAPEEWYYLTHIYNNKLEDQIIFHDDTTSTTFTNWGQPSYIYNRKNCPTTLKTYKTIFLNELKHLINHLPHLFMRKVYNGPINFIVLKNLFTGTSKPPVS